MRLWHLGPCMRGMQNQKILGVEKYHHGRWRVSLLRFPWESFGCTRLVPHHCGGGPHCRNTQSHPAFVPRHRRQVVEFPWPDRRLDTGLGGLEKPRKSSSLPGHLQHTPVIEERAEAAQLPPPQTGGNSSSTNASNAIAGRDNASCASLPLVVEAAIKTLLSEKPMDMAIVYCRRVPHRWHHTPAWGPSHLCGPFVETILTRPRCTSSAAQISAVMIQR